MFAAPLLERESTVALDHQPALPDLTATPPPASKLSRSRLASLPTAPTVHSLPKPGDEILGFRLVEELGHGTFARVFLARQQALAGREVTVKVTLKPTREPERLARLQHTNVVPVYSVHDAAPVQVICMPFLGRRTLADSLEGFRKSHTVIAGLSTRRTAATKNGTSVVGSKAGSSSPAVPIADPESGAHHIASTETGTVVRNPAAVLPILKQLADGLAHAHDRGVLHLDLKPANVLLADTGEPMLLDFNLSFAEAEGKREVIGGTIPYMAPEQLLDLKVRGKGHVDARTDLYSLGVMAFELLTGQHPFHVTSRSLIEFEKLIASRNAVLPLMCDLNPAVSPALESIVRKLLAAKPEDRYQNAHQLSEDLARQLDDRPLRYAPDRSLVERLGKWRRRNPRTLAVLTLGLAFLGTGAAGAYAFQQTEQRNARDAEARVRATRDQMDVVRIDLALPGDPTGRDRGLKQGLALLGEFGLPFDPQWQSRAAFQHVPPEQRTALAGDLGELLLLVAHVRFEGSPESDRQGAARDARILNELAGGCFPDPPPLLVRQRAELEAVLAGRTAELQPSGTAVTPRDYFLEGFALFTKGKFDAATRPLERAVAGQPNHATAHFLLARCRQQSGEYERAIERYETVSVLLPRDPRPAYYAGISLGMSGQPASAEDAFSRALAIDENFGDAYRARGVARLEQHLDREAEADFTRALERGASKLQSLHLRSLARAKIGDKVGSATDLTAAAQLTPQSELDFLARGYARIATDPRAALKDFQAALEKNPHSVAALRNQFNVFADSLNDLKAAHNVARKIVELYPQYESGRAMLALSYARLGLRTEALREVEAVRKLLSKKGPSHQDALVLYRLSWVYARTSLSHPEDRVDAFALLKAAFRSGFVDFKAVEKQPDLEPIRELPEFNRILTAAKALSA